VWVTWCVVCGEGHPPCEAQVCRGGRCPAVSLHAPVPTQDFISQQLPLQRSGAVHGVCCCKSMVAGAAGSGGPLRLYVYEYGGFMPVPVCFVSPEELTHGCHSVGHRWVTRVRGRLVAGGLCVHTSRQLLQGRGRRAAGRLPLYLWQQQPPK
jgi:hypothetical protein